MYSQQQWLEKLQQSQYASAAIDFYNQGELVNELQSRIAHKLNKPAALFFPKGMVANFCALKAAEEVHQCSNVILHKMSHLVLDEANAYQDLLKLNATLLGEVDAPFTVNDLAELKGCFSSLALELPIRRAGFKLIPWNELAAISEWCREQKVHLHMDGARLWESAPYYQKSEAEISDLFDSVYVSLYKGLGGMGGAVLAGEVDFIEQCKIWQARFGGVSFTAFPLLVSALEGLDNQSAKIPQQVQRAKEIADQLQQVTPLTVESPQSTGLFVYLAGDKNAISQQAATLCTELGIKPYNLITECPKRQCVIIEIQVGAQHHQVATQEIVEFYQRLVTQAQC